MAEDRCDIIIPVWNNRDETKQCLDSIRGTAEYPFRIIVVDNASEDLTRDYLLSYQLGKSCPMIIIRNGENLGFIRAVNQGLRFSDAKYVCVMNNDTIACPGWLKEMVKILDENPDVGMVNPDSNVPRTPFDAEAVYRHAQKIAVHKGGFRELYKCSFFCALIKRELVNKVGYLNEDYGIGYFDDADYSRRSQALGYKTVMAGGVYVFHKESSSFDLTGKKWEIFRENEIRFNSLWGRPVRIIYTPKNDDLRRSSELINRVARLGHHIMVSAPKKIASGLKLADHELIKMSGTIGAVSSVMTLLKVAKRRKNKKIDIVISGQRESNVHKWMSKALGYVHMTDKDPAAVYDTINKISFGK